MKARTVGLVLAVVLLLVLLFKGAKVAKKAVPAIRNNNPGNLRPLDNGAKWVGEEADNYISPNGGRFSRFKEPRYGWRAMLVTVGHHVLKRHKNTLNTLLALYAPASDGNAPAEYAASVGKAIGLGVDDPIDFKTKGAALVKAMARVEAGIDTDLVWGPGPREKGIVDGIRYLELEGWL